MNMPINSLIMIVAVLIVVKECFKFFCNLFEFKVVVKKIVIFVLPDIPFRECFANVGTFNSAAGSYARDLYRA